LLNFKTGFPLLRLAGLGAEPPTSTRATMTTSMPDSTQTTGNPSLAQAVEEHWRIRPASNRRQVGTSASSVAISAGVDGTFALWMTAPLRATTQMCVSAIETSKPAKYSMGWSLPMMKPIRFGFREEPPTITRC
jgi:hypothetical protein